MMTIVSIIYAIYFILQRYVVQNHDFNQTMFWTSVSQFIVGILIYAFLKSFRKSFHKMLKQNGKKIISLNLMNELLSSFGNVISTFAGTLTSVTLVSFVSQSVQPFAVMGIGLFLTAFFPKIEKECVTKSETIKRIAAIIICVIGLAFIEFGGA
jgi:drug/metabolite transporter (DMT)-like permease